MVENFIKGLIIKGSGESRGTDRSTGTTARSGGEVGAKSEPWVSPTGCVWKHDTLCRHTLSLRRRPPGLERNAGCRRDWRHRVSLRTAGVDGKYKRKEVKASCLLKTDFAHGKELPYAGSPSVILNLPNPHRHHPLCSAGLYGIVPCPPPVSYCGCCFGR